MTTASTLATLSDPLKENSHSDPSASSLLRATFAGVCGSLSLLLGAGANAQESDVALQAGFVPDPYSRIVTIGGSDSAASFDASCSGFIDSDAPGLIFDYDSLDQAGKLGIFVDADIDTTLVVIAPDGDVYCNDDSPDLAFGNPGLEIDNADSGQYRIMVGGHETTETDEEATLVVTEYGAAMWMVLDLDAGFDSLILSMVETDIEFGDDSGDWANDGECDDPRFLGNGSAMMPAFDHEGRDASDCRILFGMGEVELVGSAGLADSGTPQTYAEPALNLLAQTDAANINFGDNSSTWANDGECDDPRFTGPGMAIALTDENILSDANDCRSLFNSGDISLTAAAGGTTISTAGIDFGDNASTWANDGECDDPRFVGNGMASTTVEADRLHDANDCRTLFSQGLITLAETQQASPIMANGEINFGNDSSSWANDGECDDPRFEGDGMASIALESDLMRDASDCRSLYEAGRIQLSAASARQLEALMADGAIQGSLNMVDDIDPNGGFADAYSFTSAAGEQAVIDLRSEDFDTFLRVTSPSGEVFTNDDFQSSTSRSVVTINGTEAGTYQVDVTSYAEFETGAYVLNMGSNNVSAVADQQYAGRLESGDETLSSGEFIDTYTFTGSPGQRVSIDLSSDDFDTYVILAAPSGEQEENDDADGSNSQLVVDLTEQGTYEVWVTSYSEGETGSYRLNIGSGTSSSGSTNSAAVADVGSLSVGDSVSGELSDNDSRAITEGPEDGFVFFGEAGDAVVIDLQSGEFDTYLTLITPSGERIENDDFESSLQQSQVALNLPSSGRYRVIVSSYQGEGLGDYQLSVRSSTGVVGGNPISSAGGQIYGLFVGVADYPGVDSDLPLTDQDAERARDALIQGAGMSPGNGFTLLNEDATRANFTSALDQINSSSDEEDTLVIFYSGHGSRVPRSGGYDSRDPDGYDETMVLYDGNLIDDELANMLDQLTVGKVLLVMDSCFSGGFAKDIVSRPGRMGMFSSEEDVLSQVASKFQAGGYLSFFFEEALTQRYADRDNNGEITAIELSQYLHQRFDADVKSFGTDEYVRAQGPQASYQKLVIDRGGVGPYNVLFTRN